MKKSPQQIIQEAREEFEKKFHELVGYVFDEETKLHLINKNEELSDKILSWHTSTLQAFIEAEINIIEEKINTAKTRKRMTPFQDTLFNYEVNVLGDLLSHLKELKELTKR